MHVCILWCTIGYCLPQEVSKQERQRVEELEVENGQLEKQKIELMTAFKKQMKLIDILKQQKVS